MRAATVALTSSIVVGTALGATFGTAVVSGVASAHSLASSSVRIAVGDDDLTGTVSLAVATLDRAFDTEHRSTVLSADEYAAQVTAYVDAHLSVEGTDGSAWAEHWSNLVRRTSEGIETITIDVEIDPAGADPSEFTITYDAVIEAVDDHEAVLVLENPDGVVSTPGVFATDEPTITVGDHTDSVAMTDMVRFGFHHVLDGADHLLFLLTLLLPAPFVVSARRWRRRPGASPAARKVLHVVTAFTIGHSLTLAATSLGWISVPSRPVEVLIAASVAVSAVHTVRPLVRGGEPVIAVSFGLVHGLAFAGILHDLGLQGRTSVLALLAFNIGIELAQLAVVALVLPSLFALTTTLGDRVRIIGAGVAFVAAIAWMLDRLDIAADPFASVETTVVSHPWWVVGGLALAAVACRALVRPDATSAEQPGLGDAASLVVEPVLDDMACR
ncbi:MAG: HupE/UreJ family protein [Acidimicrobiales bacterium]